MLTKIIRADELNNELRPYSLKSISTRKKTANKNDVKASADWAISTKFGDSKKVNDHHSTDFMEQAKKEAERLVREAKQKASDIEREAYEKAFAQGEQAGTEMGMKKVEPVINSLHQVLEDLGNLREKIYENSESELVKLALLISRRVLQKEISLNREVVLNTVKAALKNAVGEGGIKIRISPLDMEFIRECRPQILSSTDGIKQVTIEEDGAILHGGCIIETDFGAVDARIENQIKELDLILRPNLKDLEG